MLVILQLAWLVLSAATGLSAMQNDTMIQIEQIRSKTEGVKLFQDHDGFHILTDETFVSVKAHDIDPAIQKLVQYDLLNKFLVENYIEVKKLDNGDFKINAKTRGLGGGPISGAIGYWLTKAAFWSAVTTAATGITVATAGTAAPAIVTGGGTALAYAGGALGVSTGIGTAATAVATATTSGLVSAATATTVVGASTTAVGAAMATGAGTAGILGAVETASVAVSAALTACPFLP